MDDLPTEHCLLAAPDAWLDLDTGLQMPEREFRTCKADARFGRDGSGFYFECLLGGAAGRPDDTLPPAELLPGRLRFDWLHGQTELCAFVRTDRGVARVVLTLADPYSSAAEMLRWVVVPPKNPVFLPPPRDLAATWTDGKLRVAWDGDCPNWLIELRTADGVRKLTSDHHWIAIPDLDARASYRVVVRGIAADNTVSLPADVVQCGPRQLPRKGVVAFPDRWYDKCAGLSLARGEAAVEDPDVVFYLYGVSVPGGGVRKLGQGAHAFEALAELPAGPYPPVHGRIDDHDVLAVRTADGRFAKLWLEPMQRDFRSGMLVHFAFLPDGRRTLLPPPGELASARADGTTHLQWPPVPGAARYRIALPGRAPIEQSGTQLDLRDLPAERALACTVVAIAADGEESEPAHAVLFTYSAAVKTGRFKIEAQNGGFVFASATPVKAGAPSDLELSGGAGGDQILDFSARGGIAPADQRVFGEFPAPDDRAFAGRWDSDARKADCDRFYVRCADGGIASIRIVERGWPRTVLEYIWMPPQ